MKFLAVLLFFIFTVAGTPTIAEGVPQIFNGSVSGKQRQLVYNALTNIELLQPVANIFSDTIKKRRLALKLSQEEAATELDMDVSDYRRYELGKVFPPPGTKHKALIGFLFAGNEKEFDLLYRQGKAEKWAFQFQKILLKNSITVEKLEHFVQEGKTYAMYVSEALAEGSGRGFAEIATQIGIDNDTFSKHKNEKSLPVYVDTLTHTSDILNLDFEQMHEKIVIENVLRKYTLLKKKYGDFFPNSEIKDALEQAEIVTNKRRDTSFKEMLRYTQQQLKLRGEDMAAELGMLYRKYLGKRYYEQLPSGKEAQKLARELAKLSQKVSGASEQEWLTAINMVTREKSADTIYRRLKSMGITMFALHRFSKTFSSHLRDTGMSLSAASERSTFSIYRLRGYLEGKALPNSNSDLREACKAFAVEDCLHMQKLVNIERIAREYMKETSLRGFLPLSAEIKDALAGVVEIIMSDYTELSRRLFKRRVDLQISQDEATKILELKHPENYRKLERSIDLSKSRIMKDRETVEKLAIFLGVSVEEIDDFY